MSDGIRIHVIGDSGPFSRTGRSIGYMVAVGETRYLLDCGVPLFEEIGGYDLKGIRGVIVTHCHDDHKRWFTDLALFHRYAPDLGYKLLLLTSDAVHESLERASGPALERSLSIDSSRVIDLPYDFYVEKRVLGPRPNFRIVPFGGSAVKADWRVVDGAGEVLEPGRAKVIVHPGTGRPRMLLKDPQYGEWVEPQSFYPFSSDFFYGVDKGVFLENGFTIEAVNAPVWHGIPSVGIKFSTGRESVVFSSDTVHDRALWERLCTEKRDQRLKDGLKQFESLPVIQGDINDFIERAWSRERFDDAVKAFDDAVVVHDVAVRDAVVHTHYGNIASFGMGKDRVLLTHSPDRMTSEWPLTNLEKTFVVRENSLLEEVGGETCLMDGDIFHKEGGRYFVGYRNPEGRHTVYEGRGYLTMESAREENEGNPLFRVDLFEDLAGRYYPVPEDDRRRYVLRPDGKVEIVTTTESGSTGVLAGNERKRPGPKGE